MKRTLTRLLRKKTSRLRLCTLLVLLCAVGTLVFYSPASVAPTESENVVNGLEGFSVALDPGHGGYDGGARAHDSGRWEKDITLEIALAVEKELLSRGATVTLTRREDICLCEGDTATRARKRKDLQARMDIALAAEADVLLSIHLNEYRKREQSGPQVFYQHGGDAGRLLAGVLQEALIAGLKPKKERVAMAGNYYVLRSKLPSALVECGFLSNPEEEKLLLTPAYHQKIAAALADGLLSYRQLLARIGGNGENGEAAGD